MKESKEKREERHDKARLNHAMKNRPYMPTNTVWHVVAVLLIICEVLLAVGVLATILWLLL